MSPAGHQSALKLRHLEPVESRIPCVFLRAHQNNVGTNPKRDKNMKSSVRRLSNLIMELFPEADKIEPKPNLDYLCMDLSWKSKDDPQRKSKRTKTFRIIISQEQIEDYEMMPQPEKDKFDDKVSKFITSKKALMVPNHNNPSYAIPPVEEWHVVA